MENFKYKLLTYEELLISLDRLSRFKLPEESYNRVFNSIVIKCLIEPKYSKTEVEQLSGEELSKIVKLIWNKSIEKIFGKQKYEKKINLLKYLVNYSFTNIDEKTKKLVNTNIKIRELIKSIDYETSPINLKFLYKNIDAKNKNEILENRKKHGIKFPISKLIIVEGITEEILLPVFAKKLKHDFDNEGIYILGAGGKSKSPALYVKMKEKVKIPIILLFDSDAIEICNVLNKTLLKKDKIIIITQGEFEDILSLNLIKRTLNTEYEPASKLLIDDLRVVDKMCDNIELFYRTRHLGEFKKSKFSKIIAENIKYETDITEEIKNIIFSII